MSKEQAVDPRYLKERKQMVLPRLLRPARKFYVPKEPDYTLPPAPDPRRRLDVMRRRLDLEEQL